MHKCCPVFVLPRFLVKQLLRRPCTLPGRLASFHLQTTRALSSCITADFVAAAVCWVSTRVQVFGRGRHGGQVVQGG